LAAPVFDNTFGQISLPNSSITSILQDHLGYLWLGTENGLVKYDGYSTKIFQPDENDSNCISGRGIVTIYEDKNNTLWIGTLNGLNKLNREDESFKTYKHKPPALNSIDSDSLQCIYEDSNGRFWVGTIRGLNLFDRKGESFTRYHFNTEALITNDKSTSNPYGLGINAIIEDPLSKELLIGTDKNGLWEFNVEGKTFSKYKIASDNNSDEKIGWIQSFYKSRDDKIWMISDHSIASLEPYKGEYKSHIEFPKMNDDIYESPCYAYGSIIEDKSGLIWFGFVAYDKGVFCLNQKTGQIQQFKLYPGGSRNSYDNMVFSLYEDRSGIIWIGTLDRGLWKADKNKSYFHLLKHDTENSNSVSNSIVNDIFSDSEGFIWFSTQSALDKYDAKKNKFLHYLKNEECLSNNRYRAVPDKVGNIWIGSDCGLIKFNPASESYSFYLNDPTQPLNLVNKSIFRLLQDHLGFLWIATVQSGLYKYDTNRNELIAYKHDPMDSSSLNDDQIRQIFEDRSGTLWVGTNYGGLNKFNRKTEKFTYCGFTSPMAIYEDRHGNFWVSDYFTGLNLLDRDKNIIIASYNQKDGLAYSEISQILEDNSGNLWLGTRNGLSKFDVKKRTFKNYFKEDGLPDNFFLTNKPAVGSDGKMYFSTKGGLLTFYPADIKDDSIPPEVVLSSISILNKSDKKIEYKGFVSELEKLTLPYNYNDLRFDYVGLHFHESNKNNYKYILENFDKDWTFAGEQRNATYTNLVPGEYVFRVSASNKDGVWSKKAASIKIIITPPWWETTFAYFLYVLLITGIVYTVWRIQIKRIKIKHEYEMKNLETKKLEELDEMKSHFFTNISHEFRTPLTLILGPSKQIIELTKNDKIKEGAKLIYRSAKKLNLLANQLLDISRIEAGQMKLQTCEKDLVPLISEIVSAFQSFAERKKISLKFIPEQEEINIYLDKDKIEKIINNVLSNAIKFTPEGGCVNVNVKIISIGHNKEHVISGGLALPSGRSSSRKSLTIITKKISLRDYIGNRNETGVSETALSEFVEISIRDTGIGIPKEQLDKIFDRFYQLDNRLLKEYEGTGVGLSLTKELVELHKGQISVESEEGKGSIFRIIFPAGKEHLLPEEIVDDSFDQDKGIPEEETKITDNKDFVQTIIKNKFDIDSIGKEAPSLLIIEDSEDVRQYLRGILSTLYLITEATNGEDGLKKAFELIPDLIISDIMMPKMDGIQFCSAVKSNSRTSHIPIILLTAKATLKDKIEGLETGADDYIMKPFEAEELKARIRSLLDQRKRMQEFFRQHELFGEEIEDITSVDKKFLRDTIKIIKENLSDSSFSVELLAKNLAVSRQLLYKKLISLVGESPNEFIKRIRLNKSLKLIERKSANISEIALEVGFSNPSYFAECFQKQFGVLPSQYHQKSPTD
jgi:signal transduction histidine kinase/ligand-binding sensor domain-containing protein/DNA-binding response OmpR family regulator